VAGHGNQAQGYEIEDSVGDVLEQETLGGEFLVISD
jgi:hypothetical protein